LHQSPNQVTLRAIVILDGAGDFATTLKRNHAATRHRHRLGLHLRLLTTKVNGALFCLGNNVVKAKPLVCRQTLLHLVSHHLSHHGISDIPTASTLLGFP
jgi:hypothetical protein